MIRIPDLKNKKTAVFGLGATGLAAARALAASGAHVFTWDENADAREKAKKTPYDPDHPKNWPWAELQFLVLSPGVPLTFPRPHAIVRKAKSAGVRVLGDVELFAMSMNAAPEEERPRVVAITGSNGKSTTTALITHILEETGRPAFAGGNIGQPLLDMPAFEKDNIYVLELSSFQLDLAMTFRANIAVLLNVSPDHLDRHGDMARYLAAKQRIFYNQTADDIAIVGVDDENVQGVCATLSGRKRARVIPVSTQGALGHGVYTLDGRLFYNFGDKSGEAGSIESIATLKGAHNWQNAGSALAATAMLDVAPSVAVKAMERFKGLPHRMETVARIDDITFVNDSKATNAEAAQRALGAYDDIYWIAGGKPKEGGVEALTQQLSNVRGAYLIGEASALFASQLGDATRVEECGNLAAALTRALADARAEGRKTPTILFSPACASYDQFKNFVDRGDTFRRLVLNEAAAKEDAAQTPGAAA
ncbi:MAG: UDP-N-acetylmuramoyl-L-alanine--D-glutamate ligase [Pseudomonadota bacterium]